MTQLFVQLAQSVTGNVITIVALNIVAAAIGYSVAWFYAKSVYKPVIKGLETDNVDLNKQITALKDEISSLNEKASKLNEKISKLEEEISEKDKEIKGLSTNTIHTGKYVISIAKNGGNYFNLKATNDQTILTSEIYSSKSACTNGIDSVRNNCDDDNNYERKLSSNNKHYFCLKASNGQVIGKSELYESEAAMENGIASVKKNGKSTVVVEE